MGCATGEGRPNGGLSRRAGKMLAAGLVAAFINAVPAYSREPASLETAMHRPGEQLEESVERGASIDKNVRMLFNEGLMHFAIDNYDAAIDRFREVVVRKPDHVDALRCLGDIYLIKEEYGLAEMAYSDLVHLAPGCSECHYFLALSQYNKSDYSRAVGSLDAAIRLEPGDSDNYFLRGLSSMALRDHISAAEDFEEVLRLEPKKPEAVHNLAMAYNNLAVDNINDKDYEEALLYISKARKLLPKLPGLEHNHRLIMKGLGKDKMQTPER